MFIWNLSQHGRIVRKKKHNILQWHPNCRLGRKLNIASRWWLSWGKRWTQTRVSEESNFHITYNILVFCLLFFEEYFVGDTIEIRNFMSLASVPLQIKLYFCNCRELGGIWSSFVENFTNVSSECLYSIFHLHSAFRCANLSFIQIKATENMQLSNLHLKTSYICF